MLSLTDLKIGTKIIDGGAPCVVVFSEHSKMGRGGAVMRTKLKNLLTGTMISKTFQGADKIESATLSKKMSQFLYADNESGHFMDLENFEQFEIPLTQMKDQLGFMAENSKIEIDYFKEKPISIELPIKMTFEVVDAPPAVRGNSAGAITKTVKISTGKEISTPIFIKVGDKIIIDTRSGEYVERAS